MNFLKIENVKNKINDTVKNVSNNIKVQPTAFESAKSNENFPQNPEVVRNDINEYNKLYEKYINLKNQVDSYPLFKVPANIMNEFKELERILLAKKEKLAEKVEELGFKFDKLKLLSKEEFESFVKAEKERSESERKRVLDEFHTKFILNTNITFGGKKYRIRVRVPRRYDSASIFEKDDSLYLKLVDEGKEEVHRLGSGNLPYNIRISRFITVFARRL